MKVIFSIFFFLFLLHETIAVEIQYKGEIDQVSKDKIQDWLDSTYSKIGNKLKLPNKINIEYDPRVPIGVYGHDVIYLNSELSHEILIPVLSHEFGHQVFDYNIFQKLHGTFKNLDRAGQEKYLQEFEHARSYNEMYSDLFSILLDGNPDRVETHQLINKEILKHTHLFKASEFMQARIDSDIDSCRHFEERETNNTMFNRKMRTLKLDAHNILCPAGSYIYNHYFQKRSIDELVQYTHDLRNYLQQTKQIKSLHKKRYKSNRKLINYLQKL
jgi:hypothetical protein